MKIEISWLTEKSHQEPQPTPILQEPSSHSMNLQGSLWGHGGGFCLGDH